MDSGLNRVTVFLSTVLIATVCYIGSTDSAAAEDLQQAKVTQVVNDVKLLPNQAAPRPAAVNDEVKQGTAVRTGNDSRTELTFKDLTITRLGSNTVFSFKPGTRDLKLTNGAVLIQVPPGAPEVKVNTSAVSAAISGGTAIFDASTGKFMVLEGEGWVWPTGHPEQKVVVHAGEMVWLTAGGKISTPEKFDVKLVLETSLLVTDFAPLPNLDLILQVIDAQQADTGPTPGATPGKTSEDIISQRTDASPTATPEGSSTPTPTPETPTPTPATPTPTPATPTPTPATPTPTPATPTPTPATPTPTPATPTPTPATPTPTPATPTPTPATPTPTPATPTPTPATPTPTPATPTPTPATPTPTPATPTPTPATPTPTPATPTPTPATPTPTPATPTPTPATPTPTPATPTPTPSTPTPTPSKTGTPQTTSSPNPYVIDSNTVITTDPAITSNGNTAFGTIYRGPTNDGPFTLWAFGSTSSFDTALNLDDEFFGDTGQVPISVFKFQSLLIAGNPTIDTTNGPTKLGLIGVDGITTGPPGGTLTFSGLDLLFLATVNGPISLTSDVSFDGIPDLAIYARGAGSDLTINSPISNVGALEMAAEGSIALNNPGTMTVGRFDATAGVNLNVQVGSLQLNGEFKLQTIVLPGTTLANGGNVTLNVTNDFVNTTQTDFARLRVQNQNAHIGTGGNIVLNVGGSLTMTGPGSTGNPEPGDFLAVVENTNGQIDNGGNITLGINGDVNVNGLDAELHNYDENGGMAGHVGTGGNIDIEVGGALNANNYLEVFVNNRGGGSIGSGGNLTLNVAGALTVGLEGAQIDIGNRYVATSGTPVGSSIGSDVSLLVHAASVSVAGNFFDSGISNRGSLINGNAAEMWNVTGGINILTDASWEILNDGGSNINIPSGGTIHGSAGLGLTADSVTANSILLQILNSNRDLAGPGGIIDSDARVNLTTNGDLTSTEADVFVGIVNSNSGGSGSGGNIGGAANVNVNIGGALTTQTDAVFAIQNAYTSDSAGGTGGMIGSDATLSLNANSISAGGTFETSIRNARNAGTGGGSIGGSATITVDVNGNVEAVSDLQFINNPGGTIGSNAQINLTAVSIGTSSTTNGSFLAQVVNFDGQIGDAAGINFNLSGNLTSASDAGFSIDNSNGGQIGEDATIGLHLTGDLTAGSTVNFQIWNFGGGEAPAGQIGGNAQITLSANNITVPESATLLGEILNQNLGQIGGMAVISVNAADTIDVGNLDLHINNIGGMIGGNAEVEVVADRTFINGALNLTIDNSANAGTIGGNAIVTLNGGDMSAGSVSTIIDNRASNILGNATINIAGSNLGADSLFAHIDSTNDGSLGGVATINSNFSGDVTINNDITYQIDLTPQTFASTSAEAEEPPTNAINVEGGFYEAGGTFRATINGGDGVISFNNVDVRADVIKVGVFADNGVLRIGGTTMSADTILRLYAPGSNGMIDFVADCTLSSNGMAVVIAAQTVTIENNVTVTIHGSAGSALVYTNVPNYDEASGGNGSTSGKFAGNGATTHPLSDAPDFETGATPTPAPTPSKFGTPQTIQTPAPYVINSGTTIITDPVIMTNGQTDYGKIYRGDSEGGDGPLATWAFGTVPSDFDAAVGFGSNPDPDFENTAVFKFQSLELDGPPSISTAGGATRLGLIAIDGITSGGDGGTFDFSGLDFVFLATENGPITLGSNLTFQNTNRLYLYARGANGNMTLSSQFDSIATLNLNAEQSLQVNGTMTNLGNFNASVGSNFLAGTGHITSGNISILSQGDINFAASQFTSTGNQVLLQATNTLNIDASGADQSVFSNPAVFSAAGTTINMIADAGTTVNFNPSADSTVFSAGPGGIHASNIIFNAQNLQMSSGGDINVFGLSIPSGFIQGDVTADGSFTSVSNVTTANLTATNGSISVGGDLFVSSVSAGTTIDVANRLSGFDSATAHGGITANQVAIPNINDPTGVLNVGDGGIVPFVIIFGPGDGPQYQHTFNVDSIVSVGGIDFNGSQFSVSNNSPGAGGRLTINARTIAFDTDTGIAFANFNGADQNQFGPANPPGGGDGGVFVVNTTQDISLSSNSSITATTGLQSSSTAPSGAGGSVTLSAGGNISIDGLILVSSNDNTDTSSPIRLSGSGGNITLFSGGQINLTENSQLLSLLSTDATGQGGQIIIQTTGDDITSNGVIEADRGTITISNIFGGGGGAPTAIDAPALTDFQQITIDGGSLKSEVLDIESSGGLTIGTSNPTTIDAFTLTLFANNGDLSWTGGSFEGVSTYSSGNVNISAEGSINILNDLQVLYGVGAITSGLNFTLQSFAANVSVGGNLDVELDPTGLQSGGNIQVFGWTGVTIDGDATLSVFPPSEFALSSKTAALVTAGHAPSILFGAQIGNLTVGGGLTMGTSALIDADTGADLTLFASDPSSGQPGSIVVGGLSMNSTVFDGVTLGNGARIQISAHDDLTVTNSMFVSLNNAGVITSHGNIVLNMGGNISVGSTTSDSLNLEIFNEGSQLGNGGNIAVAAGGNVSSAGDAFLILDNSENGNIGSNVAISLNATNFTAGGFLVARINNQDGGMIDGNATINLTLSGVLASQSNFDVEIANQNASGNGMINGNAAINLTAPEGISSDGMFEVGIFNNFVGTPIHGAASISIVTGSLAIGNFMSPANGAIEITNIFGTIDSSAEVFVDVTGDLRVRGDGAFQIMNGQSGSGSAGGVIGGNATVDLLADRLITDGALTVQVDNTASHISGTAAIGVTAATEITAGDAAFLILNSDTSGTIGTIDGDAVVGVSVGQEVDVNSWTQLINSRNGGTIGGSATLNLNVGDAVTTSDFFSMIISTRPNDIDGGPGSIGLNANIMLAADSMNIGSDLVTVISTNGGGTIGNDASVTLNVNGELSASTATIHIENSYFPAGDTFFPGGSIGGSGTIDVTAGSLSIGDFLEVAIWSQSGGSIGSNASITMNVDGDLGVTNNADIYIATLPEDTSKGPGSIGDDATITVNAGSVTVGGDYKNTIYNSFGGQIGGNASITNVITGDMNVTGDIFYRILNNGDVENDISGGQIGENASISVTAANITANSLLARIYSTQNGAIGGDSTITFNVSGTVTTTADATFDVELTELPAGPASVGATGNAITFNGGSYEVGGTFQATVAGGDGTITFNNANVHADTIKVAAFGANGVLKIGGGTIDANTMLKLYAPGSNGVIDFVANVTLNSRSTAAIINANTVTIENEVVVTITGDGGQALVYTNHPNYSADWGGNGHTSGTFAGNGAVTNPEGTPPPFDNTSAAAKSSVVSSSNSSAAPSTTTSDTTPTKTRPSKDGTLKTAAADSTPRTDDTVRVGVRVADTDELANLVAQTTSGASGSNDAIRSTKRDGSRRQNKDSDRRTRRDLDVRDKVATRTDMNRLPAR